MILVLEDYIIMVKSLSDLHVSILDLATVSEGQTTTDALHDTIDLAKHADEWGYNRFWLAEHHNMAPIASSATSVLMGQVLANTSNIRVGSGGVMLPNHSPLVIAEQFGTLESFYPDRVDLGLGRAPGTGPMTMRALGTKDAQQFPSMVRELMGYFHPDRFENKYGIRANPGEGLDIPVWLLGSSDFSARLAAELGLPYSFAGHFSPDFSFPAIQIYRENFQPSAVLDEPYVMMGLNLVAADTDEEAEFQFSTTQQQFLNLIRGNPKTMQPPKDLSNDWTESEKTNVNHSISGSIVGSPETVKDKLQEYIAQSDVDEIIFTSYMYKHEDKLHSYKLLSDIMNEEKESGS